MCGETGLTAMYILVLRTRRLYPPRSLNSARLRQEELPSGATRACMHERTTQHPRLVNLNAMIELAQARISSRRAALILSASLHTRNIRRCRIVPYQNHSPSHKEYSLYTCGRVLCRAHHARQAGIRNAEMEPNMRGRKCRSAEVTWGTV